MSKYAIIVLAAGASNRLGQPKQLVSYKNTSLIRHTLKVVSEVKGADIFVTLGANVDIIEPHLALPKDQIIINKKWQLGMGESIAASVRYVMYKNEYQGVFFSVVDQPFLTTNIFLEMMAIREKTNASIIASKYDLGQGPPTFFDKEYFELLSKISDDQGAKSIIKKYKNKVRLVDFPKGNIDIDTPDDLKELVQTY